MTIMPAVIHGNVLSIFGGAERLNLDYLRGKILIRPNDTVILAGSIVDGYGNRSSDFDVYVINAERPKMSDVNARDHHWLYNGDGNNHVTTGTDGDLYQIFDYLEPGNYAWDVEYWTTSEVSRLFQRVNDAHSDLIKHGFRAARFSYKEAGFLYRIIKGLRLQSSDTFEQLTKTVPISRLCYVLYRQFAGGYPSFRDIYGAWHAEDWDLAVYSTRSHVFDQMMALTLLERLPNPNVKWIFKKLDALTGPSGEIGNRFRAWNEMRLGTANEKKEYVLIGMDLIDDIFERCRVLLDGDPEFQSTEEGTRIAKLDQASRAGSQEFENQILYRLKMYQPGLMTSRAMLLSA